ncbi:hypothetical protein [Tumebacillus avium]|uniref:hypothetical protein n=1 Tax=Tumebacillus avium TaxID=1903704 RepID=UPI0012FE6A6F|nr:hypothetical protein [Tumebacillus avium]
MDPSRFPNNSATKALRVMCYSIIVLCVVIMFIVFPAVFIVQGWPTPSEFVGSLGGLYLFCTMAIMMARVYLKGSKS